MQECTEGKFKVIEIQDSFTDHKYDYPYFQCINSKVRFVLRSKHCYNHEPFILIQNQKDFKSLLPLTQDISLNSEWVTSNFRLLKGRFTDDGSWITELDCTAPGLFNFQLVMEPRKGDKTIKKRGTCDTIVVMQDKVDVRFLRKMSVFPRCIGHHTKWVEFFQKQYDLGYNSFHLAPIQETGMSKSYYSIADQLDLSSDVFEGNPEEKMNQLKSILKEMNKIGVTFFIDIVLNHTSFDSDWIKEKPDSVYTTQNTPHLTSAYEVDKVVAQWGNQIKKAKVNINTKMTEQEFISIKDKLYHQIVELKLEDYFRIPESIMRQFQRIVPPSRPSDNLFAKDPIESIQDFLKEHAKGIGSSKAGVELGNMGIKWKQLNLAYQKDDLVKGVQSFNRAWRKRIENEWVPQIVNNVMGEVRYNYVDNQYRTYKDQYPFVKQYFTEIVSSKGVNFYAINNGWVSGSDTSEANFIYSKEFYYLRRRVQVWGDLVRIRYGENPQDVPYSWIHMEKYVCSMASHFDGFRMDNLHGTQLHVAKYMIKKAREVNPNLIVFAELFTDTEQEKAMFVRSIGINSTLKEAQYMLNGPSFVSHFHELMGEGGPYIGSINPYFECSNQTLKYCKRKKPLNLVYDLTHDNETFAKKNIIMKQLPISMLISMMGTFIGSTKGYDQFYWKHISVIEQSAIYAQDKAQTPVMVRPELLKKRLISTKKNVIAYGSWNGWKQPLLFKYDEYLEKSWADIELPPGKYEYKFQYQGQWFIESSRYLNSSLNHQFQLHTGSIKTVYNNLEGFRKSIAKYAGDYKNYRKYYTYNDGDIVVIIRQTSDHQDSIVVIANLSHKEQSLRKPLILPGKYESSEMWYQTNHTTVKGVSTEVEIINHNNIQQFLQFNTEEAFGKDSFVGTTLPPGFACIIKSKKEKGIIEIIEAANSILKKPIVLPELSPLDYNLILFGIAREEENRFGQSNYIVPHCKQLVYAGFAGVFKAISEAKRYNKLSLPLFDNLRQGSWLLHYYIDRLKRAKSESMVKVTQIVEEYFLIIQKLPSQLIPAYFTDFIYKLWRKIDAHISNSPNPFYRKLLLASNQFICNFPNEKPAFQTTLSAGLPHFAVGWSRAWGRDTFISNELLLTQPNIYRQVILQFASVLRHGTIPNLLDFGKNPRYNCRDACWWFIRGIKEYAIKTGDYDIFKTNVNMMFLSNDLLQHNRRQAKGQTRVMTVQDVVQEIFQSHANGITYREWNAGYEIDSHMNSDGFTIHLQVDEITGFIVGGNSYNCLTWMDKMGSSEKAGTKGIPASPRCGAPVEMVGLLKHCLSSYSKLNKAGKYPYKGVTFKKKQMTFDEWGSRIQSKFQERFYIGQDYSGEHSVYHIARITEIYKDVADSKIPSEENRLRPNALIAMTLAPELFIEKHALNYLNHVKKHLLSEKSLGVGTLSEIHESLYVPYYDNDDDSDIMKISHGYSYHNGPEWVWLYGFYVLAVIHFKKEQINKSKGLSLLQNLVKYISNDQWCSLPQMTNINGQSNNFSCNAQAWSISSVIMAVQAIEALPK